MKKIRHPQKVFQKPVGLLGKQSNLNITFFSACFQNRAFQALLKMIHRFLGGIQGIGLQCHHRWILLRLYVAR